MTNFKRIILNSQDSALIMLLIVLGAVTGARDALNMIMPGESGLPFLIALLAIVIGRTLLYERRVSRLSPLPSTMGKFNPFGGRSSSWASIWPRQQETATVVSRIKALAHSHLIISGPSGAGKSTLVERLVIPELTADYTTRVIREYEGLVVRLIEQEAYSPSQQRDLIARYLKISKESAGQNPALGATPFSPSTEIACLWTDVERFFAESFQNGKPRCFVFDQVERYLNQYSSGNSDNRPPDYELFFVIKFLRMCRQSPDIRTIFVIRSDDLYESIEFLENLATESQPNSRFDYFLCPGINMVTAPEGVQAIRASFSSLNLGPVATQKFDAICHLEDRGQSNTFLTQMVGFVVEHFYRTDTLVKNMLDERLERTLSLRYYFNHFLNDFIREGSSYEALSVIKSVLFCISVENLVTGRGPSAERVAALTHMPTATVQEAISFAVAHGVIYEEFIDGAPTYLIVHDIVRDYVRENEQFTLHPILKDAMRGLIENRVPTAKLTKIDSQADVVRDLWERPNLGIYAIWSFFVFGIVKAKWELVCAGANNWFSFIPGNRDCHFVSRYYLAVYISHVVWLIFIYHIDRDQLRYVLKSRSLKVISALMPAIGAALAIVMSNSATLFILPIVSVGLIMGTLLLLGVLDGSFVGAEVADRARWGMRTLANMVITSCLIGITCLIFWDTAVAHQFWDQVGQSVGRSISFGTVSVDAVAVSWIYLVCFVMIYFWTHIRPEQQSRVSSAARLASYDRARTEPLE